MAESISTRIYNDYYDADQLYNLADDPGEQNNLAKDPEYQAILEEMKEELKKYLNSLPGTFGELKTSN